jgi:hypothetical protein
MRVRVPLGISDFPTLREQRAYYVDKTAFIVRLLDQPTQAVLFARPRRFGKTLNLSTLRTFLEVSEVDRSALFEDLEVWTSAEARRHFQRYPVIHLTFKDVKARSWKEMFAAIRNVIAAEVRRHRELLRSDVLAPEDVESLRRMMREEHAAVPYHAMLRDLSACLAAHHGRKVVILIDEYDIPIQTAYAEGYYEEAVLFFRNFLSGGLKDNPHLFKGVLTGVLRVAKESIFSGLNNVDVQSLLSAAYATDFGFTQAEVDRLVQDMGQPAVAGELRSWYDGYRFAGHTIYNPWSVMKYVASREDGFRPHWVFTGSDDVLRNLLLDKGLAMTRELDALLRGESITRAVSEHIVLREIDTNPDAVWSLLLMSGYLTARSVDLEEAEIHAALAIPNRELAYVFRTNIKSWVQQALGGSHHAVESLSKAMLTGDAETFEDLLSDLVLRTVSQHDLAGGEPERVYQAFLLGMLVHLSGQWDVRSNRESGHGRYDIAIVPMQPGRPGVVLELKKLRSHRHETADQALASAIQQIRERRYEEELVSAGASPIHVYGVVFDGKRVRVRAG